ncbi:MAG: VCBS repeat-containing protein [Phycisphaerales bacterium]|nr:VCBS repeat-containing protein [Phycisphaerales bacterium]
MSMPASRQSRGGLAAGVIVLLGSHAAVGGEIPFDARTIATADGAAAVAAADLDGDGDLDVLAASSNDDTIAWFENDGLVPPGFTERVISTGVNGASAVAARDLDGDGDIDVAAAAANGDRIWWFENSGAVPPGFTARVVSDAVERPVALVLIDVDDDGATDVLSASSDDGIIGWHRSDGGSPPNFDLIPIVSDADGARDVHAADLDEDGDVDVLAASSFFEDKVAWYENDGAADPTFTEHVLSQDLLLPTSVFPADVDRDGDVDVLTASGFDNKIAWFQNSGVSPPTFTQRVISVSAEFARSVIAADINGDRYTDVVSASNSDDTIAWYENDRGSPPKFVQWVVTTDALGATDVAAADLDGDGDPDLISASGFDDRITWYENQAPPVDDPCPADLDGTGTVGFDDLIAVISQWGACPFCPANITGNGVVGGADLRILLESWGECP